MNPVAPAKLKFPLLELLLASQGLPLKATYSLSDVANMFGVSKRAIQHRVKSGQLKTRNLPRAKFLSPDLEAFLVNSAA